MTRHELMQKVKLKIEKLTEVEMPNKAHTTDAGIDFYIPNDLNYVLKEGKGIEIGLFEKDGIKQAAIEIKPHKSCLIPMGVKTSFNKGYALVFFNRSGTATKKHLLRGACVVDADYTGQIYVNMNNVSNESQYLLPGEKLIQALLLPIPEVTISEGKVDANTERGEGGFGSSDKK